MQYQSGDVVLINRNDIAGKIIKWHTHSQWSHAAIIVDSTGKLIEATFPKVRVYSIDEYKKKYSGVVLRMNGKFYLTRSFKGENWLQQQVGNSYNLLGILSFIFNIKIKNKSYFYCSQLVYEFYEKSENLLTRDSLNFFTPRDIYDNLMFDVIEEF